jgi:hypothetical protein
VEFSRGLVILDFGPTAEITSLGVETDEPGHLWPPITLGDEFQSFPSAWVTCNVRVIVLLHNLASEVKVIGDVDFPSE